MRNLISRAALAAGALALGIAGAAANTATGTLSVTASVAASCTVGSSPVSFGSIPSTILPGALPTATGQVIVNCTAGTTPTDISLGNGLYPISGQRYMEGTIPANTIAYNLSANPAYTPNWGTATGEPTIQPGTGSPISYPVYGQITTTGAVNVDTYSDTVGITVTY